MNTLTVVLPLPPAVLNPNRSAHFMEKARARRDYREQAGWLAHAALCGMEPPHYSAARITVTTRFTGRTRRDSDNVLASLKGAVDSLVDAGILADDDCVTWIVHPVIPDSREPGVTLVIEGDAAPVLTARAVARGE